MKRLEAHGIVERELYCERPPRGEYRLTRRGKLLAPELKAMRQWGEAFGDPSVEEPAVDRGEPVGTEAEMVPVG